MFVFGLHQQSRQLDSDLPLLCTWTTAAGHSLDSPSCKHWWRAYEPNTQILFVYLFIYFWYTESVCSLTKEGELVTCCVVIVTHTHFVGGFGCKNCRVRQENNSFAQWALWNYCAQENLLFLQQYFSRTQDAGFHERGLCTSCRAGPTSEADLLPCECRIKWDIMNTHSVRIILVHSARQTYCNFSSTACITRNAVLPCLLGADSWQSHSKTSPLGVKWG